jgi:hypothetical protein
MSSDRKAAAIAVMATVLPWVAAASPQDGAVNQRIDQVLGDYVAYQRVILTVQKAVAAHDAAAVAALVSYPITVTIAGHRRVIRNPAQFIARYDRIVTPAIAGAVSAEKYGDLFVRDQGVMFGNGEMWITGVCADQSCASRRVRIVTIQSAP